MYITLLTLSKALLMQEFTVSCYEEFLIDHSDHVASISINYVASSIPKESVCTFW